MQILAWSGGAVTGRPVPFPDPQVHFLQRGCHSPVFAPRALGPTVFRTGSRAWQVPGDPGQGQVPAGGA